MKKGERFTRILEILQTEGSASTRYLADLLQVSEVTIRRDLAELSSKYSFSLQRVHGGVVYYSSERVGLEPVFDIKLSQNVAEKREIARIAAGFVEDGDTVVLDSGSTCYYLAKELPRKRGLKVVVVDIRIAEELSRYSAVQTIVVGGEIRSGYFSIGGEMAVRYLAEIRADKAFVATDGWDLEGTYNASPFEVGIKRAILQSAARVFLVADHTKYGRVAFLKVAPLEAFEGIVTDQPLPEEVCGNLKERGLSILWPEQRG